jgi:hypothetical protein
MSHNVVAEINNILKRNTIDTAITFGRDIWSIMTYCAGCVQVTYEPIQYVHLNPFPAC